MANDTNFPHELRLQDRKRLTVSGVQEVESFDENAVALVTQQGLLVIRGEELQLKSLAPEGGQVCVQGLICSLDYEQARKAGGIFKRLFG